MFSQQPLISQYCSTHTLDCQWTAVSTAQIDSGHWYFCQNKKSSSLLPARNSSNKSLPQLERPPCCLDLQISYIVPWDSKVCSHQETDRWHCVVSQSTSAGKHLLSELGRNVSAFWVTQRHPSLCIDDRSKSVDCGLHQLGNVFPISDFLSSATHDQSRSLHWWMFALFYWWESGESGENTEQQRSLLWASGLGRSVLEIVNGLLDSVMVWKLATLDINVRSGHCKGAYVPSKVRFHIGKHMFMSSA